MNNNYNRQIWFIALVILFGCLIGTCMSLFIGTVIPDGVVKDFFLSNKTIGFGQADGHWIDLNIIKFNLAFRFNVSIISIFGMASSWYLLRYFR